MAQALAQHIQVEENNMLGDIFSTIVLRRLALEHYIPLFEAAGIGAAEFLTMTEAECFRELGLSDIQASHQLAKIVCAIRKHIDQESPDVLPDACVTRPPASSSSATLSITHIDGHTLWRALDAVHPGHAQNLSFTSSFSSFDKGNQRSSYISMRSECSTVATVGDDCRLDSGHWDTFEPPLYHETHEESQQVNKHMAREGEPGTVIPRLRVNTPTPRPVSLPAYFSTPDQAGLSTDRLYLKSPSRDRSFRPVGMASPPPDYHDSVLMARWEKCRSCVIPREEEGREELPAYKCTVYKAGYVYVKREMDSPGVKSRKRSWRKYYMELWGTILHIYRSEPPVSMTGRSWIPFLAYWDQYHYSHSTFSLAGAEAVRAWDYAKHPYAVRLTLSDGPQFLLRMSKHATMVSWIEHLQAGINISLDLEQRPMPKFVTLPLRSEPTSSLSPRTLALERLRQQRLRTQQEILI